jgi:hypothetical protein
VTPPRIDAVARTKNFVVSVAILGQPDEDDTRLRETDDYAGSSHKISPLHG